MDTILITGGNGNLGRLIAERFEDRGTAVISFDLPGTEGPHSEARDTVIAGDIRNADLLREIITTRKPGAILHLASLLSGSSEANPDLAWEVNATASVALMRAAHEAGAAPFVFASTIATYGPDLPEPLAPDAPQWPENIYGVTKVAVERMGVYLRQKQGFDFRCLRFPLVLSPFAPPGAVTAYPSHAFRAALDTGAFTFPVSPETGMSNLFLDDVVDSLIQITLADRARLAHPAYNLHAYAATAQDIADYLTTHVQGFSATFAPDPVAERLIGGWPNTVDTTPARTDWDWSPTYDFAASADALMTRLSRS